MTSFNYIVVAADLVAAQRLFIGRRLVLDRPKGLAEFRSNALCHGLNFIGRVVLGIASGVLDPGECDRA
jgi:hypothetical protein